MPAVSACAECGLLTMMSRCPNCQAPTVPSPRRAHTQARRSPSASLSPTTALHSSPQGHRGGDGSPSPTSLRSEVERLNAIVRRKENELQWMQKDANASSVSAATVLEMQELWRTVQYQQDDMERATAELREEYSRLKAEFAAVSSDRDRLAAERSKLLAEHQTTQADGGKQLSELREEVRQVTRKLTEQTEIAAAAKQRESGAEARIATVSRELTHARDEITSLQSLLKDFRDREELLHHSRHQDHEERFLECENLRAQNTLLQDRVAMTAAELADLRAHRQRILQENTSLLGGADEDQKRLHQALIDIDALRGKYETAERMLGQKDTEIGLYKKKLDTEARARSLEKTLPGSSAQDRVDQHRLMDRVAELEQLLERSQNECVELSKLRDRNEVLEREVEQMRFRVEREMNDYDRMMKESTGVNHGDHPTVADLRTTIDDLRRENNTLCERLVSESKAHLSVRPSVSSDVPSIVGEERVETLLAALRERDEALRCANATIHELKLAHAVLENRVEKYQITASDARVNMDASAAEGKLLHAQADTSSQALVRIGTALTKVLPQSQVVDLHILPHEVEAVVADLLALRKRAAYLEERFSILTDESEAEKRARTNECIGLENRVSDLQRAIDVLSEQLKYMTAENHRRGDDEGALRTRMAAAEQLARDLDLSHTRLAAQLESERESYRTMEDENTALRDEIRILSDAESRRQQADADRGLRATNRGTSPLLHPATNRGTSPLLHPATNRGTSPFARATAERGSSPNATTISERSTSPFVQSTRGTGVGTSPIRSKSPSDQTALAAARDETNEIRRVAQLRIADLHGLLSKEKEDAASLRQQLDDMRRRMDDEHAAHVHLQKALERIGSEPVRTQSFVTIPRSDSERQPSHSPAGLHPPSADRAPPVSDATRAENERLLEIIRQQQSAAQGFSFRMSTPQNPSEHSSASTRRKKWM